MIIIIISNSSKIKILLYTWNFSSFPQFYYPFNCPLFWNFAFYSGCDWSRSWSRNPRTRAPSAWTGRPAPSSSGTWAPPCACCTIVGGWVLLLIFLLCHSCAPIRWGEPLTDHTASEGPVSRTEWGEMALEGDREMRKKSWPLTRHEPEILLVAELQNSALDR